MSKPSTPQGWARRLNAELSQSYGTEHFPLDVERIALDYTKRNFDDPITKVSGEPLDGFEGGLFPSPSGKPRWLIAYNSVIRSKERIRYTVAHELGHYLLHRRPGERIQCSPQDMSIWRGEYQRREVEANRFAAGVLMPTDDYRQQVDGQPIDLELFRCCAGRYGVSLTPAILEWLSFTPELAILVRSLDGFIDWGVSSTPAFRKGAFFRTRGCPPRPELFGRSDGQWGFVGPQGACARRLAAQVRGNRIRDRFGSLRHDPLLASPALRMGQMMSSVDRFTFAQPDRSLPSSIFCMVLPPEAID